MAGETSWLDEMPAFYDRCLGPALFAPYARHLATLAAAEDPRSVLELAAGTGIVTAELARALPTAAITATDLNPAMVALGGERVTGPTWLVADAQSLAFADSTFDLIVCQFGVMFFPDQVAAFAEAARVLRPGGRYVFAVWDRVDASSFPQALTEALADLFPDDPPDFVARVPHGYHDVERIRSDVTAGGLLVEGIDRVGLHGTAPSARAVAEGFCLGTPLRFALQERGDPQEIAVAVAARMAERLGDGPIEGDLSALVVTARPS